MRENPIIHLKRNSQSSKNIKKNGYLIVAESSRILVPFKKLIFNYFNPKTEKYVEVTTKEYFVSVEKGKEYIPTDTNEVALQNLNLLQNTSFLSINRRELISKWYSSIYWSIFFENPKNFHSSPPPPPVPAAPEIFIAPPFPWRRLLNTPSFLQKGVMRITFYGHVAMIATTVEMN